MDRAPIARVKQAGSSWCSGKTIRAHEQFVRDPAAAHKGFRSWDDFHTRRCWPGVRPIASPGDDAVVANPCGPMPYRIAREVSTCDIQVAEGQHVSKGDEIGMFTSAARPRACYSVPRRA